MRIYNAQPNDWRELESKVAEVLIGSGYNAWVDKKIQTVRGRVDIDVFAEDDESIPKIVCLVECKYWTNDIPQTIVHSFRTVVNDYGANLGIIIAKEGFQSGSYEAVKNTNIKLLTWFNFLDLFETRWLDKTLDKLNEIGEPLRDFTDPLDMIEKYNHLDQQGKENYKELCVRYIEVAMYSSKFLYQFESHSKKLKKEDIDGVINKAVTSNQLFEENILSYDDYFNTLFNKCKVGIKAFTELFGS